MRKSLSVHGRSLNRFTKHFLLILLLFFWSESFWGQTTATYTFSSLGTSNITLPSGNVDGNIAFTTSTGTAGTATQYNGGGSDLRLYNNTTSPYNGGALILTPQNGATITAVEFTTASTYIPTMRYSIGAASLTAADPSISRTSLTYSVTGLGVTSSIRIRNANTSTLQMRMLTVKVTYTGGSPTITSPTTSLTGFSTTPSASSATQTFNVSGSALTNDIAITPPTNYEISTTDGVGFTATNPITLTQTGGTVATTPIYVRLKSGLSLGAYNLEEINITSSGATARKVTVSGDVVRRTITSTTSGDWNTGSTWVGGVAPTSADNVVIATGHTVSVGTGITRDTGATTTVNGSFQLNNGGYAGGTAFTYAATGSGLIFNNGSVYGVGAGNAFWPTTNPPFNVTINTGSGAKLDTPVGAVAGTLALSGQLDAVNAITVSGALQLNGGGYVSTNAPIYGSSSSLVYNTSYGVGLEWTGTGTTAGSGIPNNVTIQNNAVVTYGALGARGVAGILTISSGSLTAGDILNVRLTTSNAGTLTTNSIANFTGAVTNTGTFNSNGVSNLAAAFTNSGSASVLNLNNDFKLAGNWSNAGTFNPNNKAVFFNGATGTQTITNTNAASSSTETFAYLVNDKAAGTLSIASNINISGTAGDVFQLINVGSTSLNGANRTITFNGNGGNILVSGAQRTITGTASTATIVINGTKTVRSAFGGSLVLGTNITTKLSNGINFGAGVTTISNILEVNSGGFVNTNAPIYASTSTLTYNGVTGPYGVNNEWTAASGTIGTTAGFPQNVTLTGNAIVNMPATVARGLTGNLTINSGSTLSLGTSIGADLNIAGNFSNNGTFTPNNREVVFNGDNTDQTVSSLQAFDYLRVNKNNTGSLTLASNITVNKDLTLVNKSIVLGSFNLTLPNESSLITSGSSSYLQAIGTGQLIRQNLTTGKEYIFPLGIAATGRYAPVKISNLSAGTNIGMNVATISSNTSITPNVADWTKVVLTQWKMTSSNNVTANVYTEWQSANQGSAMVNTGSTTGDLGVSQNAGAYQIYDVNLAQYNTQATNVTLSSTGTNAVVVGNEDAVGIRNDDCTSAVSVTLNAAAISGTNTGATQSIAKLCGGSGSANDVWYKFTTTSEGTYQISVTGASSVDAVLNLYSGTCANLTSLSCVDVNGSGSPETITQQLNANTTYFYRVYSYSSTTAGTFTTSVTTVPTITVSPTSLAFGDVSITTDSAVKTFTVKASLLTPATGNITLTAPTGYQLSLDGTTAWSSSLNLPFATSTLAETTIYTKLNPSTCGDFNGNIAATGGGAATTNVAVTGKGIISAPTATAGTDITATTFAANWNAITGATGYELDVYQKVNTEVVLLNSTFSDFTGTGFTGGNDGSWSGSIASANVPASYAADGWSFTRANGGFECLKAGSGSGNGMITTPTLSGLSGNAVLTFRAGGFGTDNTTLTVSISGGGTVNGDTSANLVNGAFSSYTVNIVGGTSSTRLIFQSGGSSKRFFIDDIKVVSGGLTNVYVSGYNPKVITGGSAISEVVTGLSPNTQYYYRLRATTATCESANSNEVGVLTNNSVIWNGSAWSNITGPTATLDAKITGAYSLAENFETNNLEITSTGSLDIQATKDVTVNGNITLPSDNKITVESDANLVQKNLGADSNSSNAITVKRTALLPTKGYTLWSAPVSGQNLYSFSNGYNQAAGTGTGTPWNRFFVYRESSDTFVTTVSGEITLGSSSSFAAGRGYAIKGKNSYTPTGGNGTELPAAADTFVFNGKMNNGAISSQLLKNSCGAAVAEDACLKGYNLIGNPYPSNLDFDALYSANSSKIYGTAYFWTNNDITATASQSGSNYSGNNYAIYNLTGGTPAVLVDGDPDQPTSANPIPNGTVKVGQGFIIKAKKAGAGSAVDFTNAMRVGHDADSFFYNAKKAPKNRFWIKMSSPSNIVNTALVGYIPGATDGFEIDYDGELFVLGSDSFYSILGNRKLAIQGRAGFEVSDAVPVGAKYSENGTYKISLGNKEGLFATDQKIYLRDKLTNTYTDLTTGSYSFAANTGVDDNRFEIVYKDNAVLGTDTSTKSEFSVYRDGGTIVIKSSKSLGKIEVYDTTGRLLITSETKENLMRIDASTLVNGVYIIKAENSGDVKTKKVIR